MPRIPKKTRPSIPEIDLARITTLPVDRQRTELEQIRKSYPPFTYRWVRLSILDIFNVSPGMLPAGPRTSWEQVRSDITARCKSADELEYNLRVASGLYKFAESESIRGVYEKFHPLPIGVSQTVSFWSPAVILLGGRQTAVFVDPRSTKRLTAEGRRFALSAMHQRIRLDDPDFSDLGLAILQFTKFEKETGRVAKAHLDAGVELFTLPELQEMTQQTYTLWEEVWEARREAAAEAAETETPALLKRMGGE